MNEALRKLLEARGLDKGATEDQAWEFYLKLSGQAQNAVARDATGKDDPKNALDQIEQMRLDRIRESTLTVERERARITEIDKLCVEFDCPDEMRVKMIGNGTSIEDAKTQILQWVKGRVQTSDDFSGRRISFGPEGREKFREAALEGLIFRGGIKPRDDFAPQGHPYVEMPFVDLARECLRAANRPIPSDPKEILKRAMTDSDLPYITAGTANKYLFTGWLEAPTTYQIWCDEGSLPNYNTATFPRPSAFNDLLEVNPADGEYKYGSISERVESVTLKHWGRLLNISTQTMVNDNLGVFTSTAQFEGQAARRTIDKYVYHTVLGAGGSGTGVGETMGDGNALFNDANHSNYVTTGGAITVATLDALANKMENQTDPSGANVGEPFRFILANPYYRATLTQIIRDTSPVALGSTSSPVAMPWPQVVPVITPLITYNSNKWWAVAGPRGKTVRVFGLNGPPQPVTESRAEFTQAGWTFKVTCDFVAKALDWIYVAANDGS